MSSKGWSRKMNRMIREVRPEILRVARESSDLVLTETVRNVSGPGIGERPSSDNPAIGKMPVPIRSKQLRRSIKRVTIFPWLFAIHADPTIAPHAKWVHNGTRKMKPRRFLWDTIKKNYRKIHSAMNKDVLKKIRAIGRA